MTVARWRAAVEGFQLLTESSSVRSIDLCWTRTLCLHIWPPSFPHLVLGERERGEREGRGEGGGVLGAAGGQDDVFGRVQQMSCWAGVQKGCSSVAS